MRQLYYKVCIIKRNGRGGTVRKRFTPPAWQQSLYAKPELKQTSADLDNDKRTTVLKWACPEPWYICMIVSYMPACSIGTHRQSVSGLRPTQKSLSRLPLVAQNFPLLLVRRLHRTSEYLDPVSISPKTSIMQTGLIRSALITISNDGNNMKLCVFVLPALPCRRRCWRAAYTVLSRSVSVMSGAGELVGAVMVMKGWRGRCSVDSLGSGARLSLKSFKKGKPRSLTLCTRRMSQHVDLYRPSSSTTDAHAHTRTQEHQHAKSDVNLRRVSDVQQAHRSDGNWLDSTAGLHLR